MATFSLVLKPYHVLKFRERQLIEPRCWRNCGENITKTHTKYNGLIISL